MSSIYAMLFLAFGVVKGYELGNSLFYYSRYREAYEQSKQDCAKIGGFLATVDTPDKFDFIISEIDYFLLENQDLRYRIGFNDIDGDKTVRWQDGIPVVWAKWHPGNPSFGGEKCGEIVDKLMNDISCGRNTPFICEVVQGSAEALMHKDTRSCWVANDIMRPIGGRGSHHESDITCPRNKIYFSPTNRLNLKTWSEAGALCQEAHGQLAKVTNEAEQLIVEKFRKIKLIGSTWLGGNDLTQEGDWRWVDGEAFTWGAALGSPTPRADTSVNCLITYSTKLWGPNPCHRKWPVLCEKNINATSEEEFCYWTTPQATWMNTASTCQEEGGRLAIFRNVHAYEQARKVFQSIGNIFIGLVDVNRTNAFRWHDGTVPTWSWWPSNGPSGTGPFGGLTTGFVFMDYSAVTLLPGLCEKTVPSVRNADAVINAGQIEIVCHESCSFPDGKTNLTLACKQTLPEGNMGCICQIAEWILFEPWDSQLNLFVLYDQDPNTCLNLIDAPLVHTLHSKDILQNQSIVRVVLPENLETVRPKMIKVLKSDYENIDIDYSLSFKRLMECEFRHDNEYLCICEDYCQLFVRITTASISVQSDEPLAVCEIQIIN